MEKKLESNSDVKMLKALARIVNQPGPDKKIKEVLLDTIELFEKLGVIDEKHAAEEIELKRDIESMEDEVLAEVWNMLVEETPVLVYSGEKPVLTELEKTQALKATDKLKAEFYLYRKNRPSEDIAETIKSFVAARKVDKMTGGFMARLRSIIFRNT